MGSWKTTSAGIAAVLGGLVTLYFSYKAGTLNEGSITAAVTAILGGLGLIFARDNDKSSEDVGAKQPK
jgi:hypothetical protein